MRLIRFFYWDRILDALLWPVNIALVLIYILGCAPIKQPHSETYQVDSELEFWVSEFETASVQHGRPIEVRDLIATLEPDSTFDKPNQLAFCRLSSNSTPQIRVRASTWSQFSEWDKRQLMFHELGHCILRLGHNDSVNANNVPTSIMNTYHFGAWYYNQNTFANYDSQLFGSSSTVLASEVSK